MHKLTFKLKQHTPLIHFQHVQNGATIRATELKPKFDKFLIDRIGREICKNWMIKGQENALNYKVKILSEGEKDPEMHMKETQRNGKWNSSFPTFFANMGKDSKEELVNFSMYDHVMVTFTCFIEDLKNKILEHFHEFMAITNFGTRQSKGFGSFYLDENDDNYIEITNETFISTDNRQNIEKIFEIINYYYQRLKSGINFKDHYRHSFLKLFLSENELGYSWEKRWIKEKFMDLDEDGESKKYARSMLGVVDNYTFIRPRILREGEVYPPGKMKIQVDSESVERFRSPLIFKPVKNKNSWKIFINTVKIPDEMKNIEFKFSSDNISESIRTPSESLDLDDLINSYHRHLGESFDAYNFRGRICNVKINQV